MKLPVAGRHCYSATLSGSRELEKEQKMLEGAFAAGLRFARFRGFVLSPRQDRLASLATSLY